MAGFFLHAGVVAKAHERARLERPTVLSPGVATVTDEQNPVRLNGGISEVTVPILPRVTTSVDDEIYIERIPTQSGTISVGLRTGGEVSVFQFSEQFPSMAGD